jgi:hypothetical protein
VLELVEKTRTKVYSQQNGLMEKPSWGKALLTIANNQYIKGQHSSSAAVCTSTITKSFAI